MPPTHYPALPPHYRAYRASRFDAAGAARVLWARHTAASIGAAEGDDDLVALASRLLRERGRAELVEAIDRLAGPRPLFVVVEGHGLLCSYWHAMRDNPGQDRALRAVLRWIDDKLASWQPEGLVVALDCASRRYWRHDLFPEYKANREDHPADLAGQLDRLPRALDAMGVAWARVDRAEADDIIGTLVARDSRGREVCVVTGDKDLMQVVDDPDIWIYDPKRKARVGVREVLQRWGVLPHLIPDLLALMGDSSDGIPGLPRVGEKIATATVQLAGPIEAILGMLDDDRLPKRPRELLLLTEQVKQVQLFRQLTRVRTDLLGLPPYQDFRVPQDRPSLRDALTALYQRSAA